MPVELDRSAGGCEKRGEHLDGGGLSRAIRPEEGEDLTGAHLEGHVVHGREVAKLLHQVVNADDRTAASGPGMD